MISFSRKPVIPTPKSPYARPGKRIPRCVCTDGAYAAGLIAGHRAAISARITPDQLNDAYHRGHSAGMYAAASLLAEHLGITL